LCAKEKPTDKKPRKSLEKIQRIFRCRVAQNQS
jgi:hypothetical protein